MEKRNTKDMDNCLDSLEYLIRKDKNIRKMSEILRELIQIQLEGAKEYVSKLPDQEKKKKYEDRIKHLEELFYENEGEESNCLSCYA